MLGSDLFSKLVKQFPPLEHAHNLKRRSERKFFYIFLVFASVCIAWLVYFVKRKMG